MREDRPVVHIEHRPGQQRSHYRRHVSQSGPIWADLGPSLGGSRKAIIIHGSGSLLHPPARGLVRGLPPDISMSRPISDEERHDPAPDVSARGDKQAARAYGEVEPGAVGNPGRATRRLFQPATGTKIRRGHRHSPYPDQAQHRLVALQSSTAQGGAGTYGRRQYQEPAQKGCAGRKRQALLS